MMDFQLAAKEGCMAVVDGHISPYNPADDSAQHVFFYNGLLFTPALDNKEFKFATGPDAARKLASHDLKNARLVETFGVPGLCTLLQAIGMCIC